MECGLEMLENYQIVLGWLLHPGQVFSKVVMDIQKLDKVYLVRNIILGVANMEISQQQL